MLRQLYSLIQKCALHNKEMGKLYHTIETKLELSANTFHFYKNKLYNLCIGKAKFYEDNTSGGGKRIYHCEFLKNKGIHIKLAYFTFNDFTRFYLILRINPKRMLNNNDFISVTHESEVAELFGEVNGCLSDINIYDKFENFVVDRIDYCYNHKFSDEVASSRYMELLKRSALLHGFSPILNYSKTQHRRIDNEDAIYVRNKSVTINFYNKYNQTLKSSGDYYSNLENYKGIIRFEIQCRKSKVRSMKYSNDLPDLRAFRWLKEEFSEKTLLFYINKVFCSGSYFTLSEAKQAIIKTNFRDTTKQAMLDLLELTNSKRSLQKALDIFYSKGFAYDYMNRILNKFDAINVNPVTIPINWKIPFFCSPLELVTQAIEKENTLYFNNKFIYI